MKRKFQWCMAFLAAALLLSIAARAEQPNLKFTALLAQRVSEVRSSLSFPNMPKLWRPDTSGSTSGVIVIVDSLNPNPGLWMEFLRQDFQLTGQEQGQTPLELQGLCLAVPDPPAIKVDGPWYLDFSSLYIMSTNTVIRLQLLFEVPLDVDAVNLTFKGQTATENLPIGRTTGS